MKSYVSESEKNAQIFRQKADPADIPIIVYDKKKPIYAEVMKSLNQRGKEAVEKIQPWLINLLVDWCSFDQVICAERAGI